MGDELIELRARSSVPGLDKLGGRRYNAQLLAYIKKLKAFSTKNIVCKIGELKGCVFYAKKCLHKLKLAFSAAFCLQKRKKIDFLRTRLAFLPKTIEFLDEAISPGIFDYAKSNGVKIMAFVFFEIQDFMQPAKI